MKKQLLLTRMLLLVALLVGSVSAWGETAGYTPSSALSSSTGTVTGTAGEKWSYSITWHQNTYYGYGASYGWQIGAGDASGGVKRGCKAFSISTSDIEGTITQIEVEAGSYQGNSKIYVTVGGSDFGTQGQNTNNGQGALKSTFTGSASGEIVISATDAVRAFYLKSIKVTYSSGPSISASDKNIAFDATSGEFGYTLNNPVTGGVLSATENVDWITDVTVDAVNSKVTFNTTANTESTPRVGTITMTYKKDDETLATKEVKITQAKAVVKLNYSLATQVVPGRHYIITSGTNGAIKAMGAQNSNNRAAVAVTENDGKISIESDAGVYEFVIAGDETTGYYTIYDTENTGYLYAASSGSNYLRTQNELDANGKWTIDIDNDNDGVATITAQGSNTHNCMRYNSSNSLFSCYEPDKQSDIYLFERVGDTSIQNADVSIAANKEWITYCCPFALDFSEDIEGLEGAYTISSHTSGATTLTATRMDGMVKAGTGLLLHAANVDADNTQAIAIKMAGTGVEQSGNMLKGVIVDTEITPTEGIYTNLGLKNGSFVPYSAEGTIAANKAYLQIPTAEMPETGDAKLTIIFDNEPSDETTAIAGVEVKKGAGVAYNLAGQRVSNPTKGLYIINGKKVIIK